MRVTIQCLARGEIHCPDVAGAALFGCFAMAKGLAVEVRTLVLLERFGNDKACPLKLTPAAQEALIALLEEAEPRFRHVVLHPQDKACIDVIVGEQHAAAITLNTTASSGQSLQQLETQAAAAAAAAAAQVQAQAAVKLQPYLHGWVARRRPSAPPGDGGAGAR